MYYSTIKGLANFLATKFEYDKSQVKIGATDSFWNKHNLDRIQLPGLIFAVSNISFPKGFSAHTSGFSMKSNSSNTTGFLVIPVSAVLQISIGMIGKDFDEHCDQIHKYVEMGREATFSYDVQIDDMNIKEIETSLVDLEELSPPPSGKEYSTYDPEGQRYSVEGGFKINTLFLFTQEWKLIRGIRGSTKVDGF